MRGAMHARWAACAVAVALAATACGGGNGGGSGDAGAVLSASWGDPQNPLEPANTNEVQGGKVLDMIFRGLKRYDPETGEAKDMLAERIETSDSRNFRITVKDGWTFSNGEKVTARSFVDAWNYGASLRNNQRNSYFFGYIEGYDKVHPEDGGKQTADTLSGLKVVDERTFTVKLTQTFSTFPDTLGYNAFAPLPRAFFDDHDAWVRKPVGNGPYRVESYTRGSQMSLRTWEDYPGEDKAQNGGVDLKVYTDNNTAYTDLMAGNLDLVDDVPAAQLKNVKNDLGDRYLNTPAGIIQTLAFPYYDDAWNKPGTEKVRKGLSMAIDRKQITDTIFQKTRTPATDWTSPVLGEDGGFAEGLCGEACEYRPDEAKKLIEEGGGLPGGRVTITFNADTGSHREWVNAVCNSINNALDNERACTANPVGTFADFRNQITGRKMGGPFRAGWQMDYPLIQNFLQPLYYTNASSNDGKWSDKEFDRLVDRANQETDTAEAIKLFQQAEEVVRDRMAAIPLWYQNGSAGWSERLSDVKLNPFSVPVYDQIKVS
ncbi:MULTISPECIES: peptide ABC transporter substrate-binding protein [Streptomyces]|jgi:ABC-type oligopeptide transport system substrate-binding subunit|uniref:ABC-type oligopeptide transport system substrate-binding subunit n=2 Tax=Streptomyces TaxID=1883 RepID=A0A514JPF6_9ACTN|nr:MULTISPECIES: ABC transporter substrate-binding protein [Streptomyces]MBA8946876.1 ABC-type oligopeptide transport system substrate-binding subunit [Streptomyces calvus]MBA8974562.1 ABC-type oligopeptide transport system substrate-binding subunit [Streptomyces calvus]MYS27350.1 ABC transporter substrate-binding protein [Streptomyces sp. SID7804]QDI69220.1 peptide ABC transporter substrate-binding protein [Streptomyces calvus]GGP72514.1 peptide ABC transporter substrate-binding protein [Stre